MAAQLDTVLHFDKALRETTDETAVHETRKAIRRTFTAFRLFEPFFIEEVVDYYQWQLKKVMRRLARCRDLAVLLQKLQQFQAESPDGRLLDTLISHYEAEKETADKELRHFLAKSKRQRFLQEYQTFVQTTGQGVFPPDDPYQPTTVKHVAPVLIAQRLASVRVYESVAAEASLVELHSLRLQLKELRYTLEFFSSLLGPEIQEVLALVRQLLEGLGHLNDAHVAMQRLETVPGMETAVSIYRAAKESEISLLRTQFVLAWQTFNTPAWRQNLGTAVAIL